MAAKSAVVIVALIVGALAVPTPEDVSFFYPHADPSARIVGGTQAVVGAHPHMVAMTNGALVRSFLCGGSLISSRTVLTAAHCIAAVFSWGSLSTSLRVTVGTNRWNSGGQLYAIQRNVTHPNYVSQTIKNDIGVLITASPVIENQFVRPIQVTYDHIGVVNSRVAGWGRIRAGGALSTNLLEINVATIDGQACVAAAAAASIQLNMRAPPVEPHIEICTFHSAGVGTCNGDSGSALARTSDNRQIGVVSWGFPCALGAPDMFVRVSAYRDWLTANTV